MTKIAGGGSLAMRPASRMTNHAATPTTTAMTSTPATICTAARPVRSRCAFPHRKQGLRWGPPAPTLRSCGEPSDTYALGEQLPVVGGVAEEDLRALRPLEVQVSVVLPGEADAAVDLDVLGGGVEVRVGAVRLGEARDDRELLVVLGCRPRRVVRRRLRRLDLEQHVGALVLDCLERADGATELHAHLRVLDRHLEHLLSTTDLLGGQTDRSQIQHGRQRLPTLALGAEQRGRGVGELELGLLSRLVHGAE